MSQPDYHSIYRLEPSTKRVADLESSIDGDMPLDQAVDKMMRFIAGDNKYLLHRRIDGESVEFGEDHYNDRAPGLLVLSVHSRRWKILGSKTTPVVALRYQVVRDSYLGNSYSNDWKSDPDWKNDPENYLGICYVQTLTNIDEGAYSKATKILGIRPHEFIVAQFLSRVAPILHTRPQTKVILNGSKLASRKNIRDRFFDKQWRLNPNKNRVRQILGEENEWLKPEKIEARRKK